MDTQPLRPVPALARPAGTPLWFRTDDHREADRQALAEAGIAAALGRFRLRPATAAPLAVSLLTFTHGPIGALTCCLSPALLEREPDDIAPADHDHLLLFRPVFGPARVWQQGRTAEVAAGDALLVSLSHPVRVDASAAARLDLLRFPRVALGASLSDLDGLLLRSVDKQATVLQLLTYYAGALLQQLIPLRTQAQERTIVLHLLDILGLLFQGDQAADALPDKRIATRRLAAIKADIEAHLHHPDLALETVAARQRISPRYIQKLLRSEGASFSGYVLDRRLEEAYRRLRSSDAADRTISSIAYEAGFSDLSYFNRRFRDKFGLPPSRCRGLPPGPPQRKAGE